MREKRKAVKSHQCQCEKCRRNWNVRSPYAFSVHPPNTNVHIGIHPVTPYRIELIAGSDGTTFTASEARQIAHALIAAARLMDGE